MTIGQRSRRGVLALVVLLAGCGGGGTTTQTTGTGLGPPPSTTSKLSPTPTFAQQPAWPYAKLVASLSGRTLVVGHATVRLDPALLVCNGGGAPVLSGGARRWRSYTCTQTLFQGGADRDVTFDVEIVSKSQLRIVAPRYGPN
jgi:hypothetical protein